MQAALMTDRLRARRDAWTLFSWLALGAAIVLTAMPGDFFSVRALHTLLGLVALFAVAGALVLAAGVLRRDRGARDALVGAASLTAAVLILVTLL
jgi:peptidoglycan/LPS O-acetylase OafA/YrhL